MNNTGKRNVDIKFIDIDKLKVWRKTGKAHDTA